MKNDNRYHSNLSGNGWRSLALAAIVSAAALTACTDDIAPADSHSRLIALSPTVTLDGQALTGTFGTGGSSRAAGTSVITAPPAAYVGIRIGAFAGSGLDGKLLAEQNIGYIVGDGNSKPTDNDPDGIDNTLHLPGAGSYTFTLTGSPMEGIANAPGVPVYVGTIGTTDRGTGATEVPDDATRYLAPLTFSGTGGKVTGISGFSGTVAVGDDGKAEFPLTFASAGIDLSFTTAEGYRVVHVSPAEYVAGALLPTGGAAATPSAGKVGYYAEFDPSVLLTNASSLTALSTGGGYYTHGAVIPGTYAAGDIIAYLTVTNTADQTSRVVPLSTPAATTYAAGSLYSYRVLVDGVRASISGNVTVSGFVAKDTIDITKGGEAFIYNEATNTFTVYTAQGLHDVSAAINDDDDTNGTLASGITLGDNIDMKGVAFTPIGSGKYYTGTFTGNGMTISNLRIAGGDSGYSIGLIGNLGSGGSVKNVTLANPEISGNQYVGGIVGLSDNSSDISGCKVSGGSISGNTYIGGIAGCSRNSTITDCEVSGTTTITGTGNNVGGIVGSSSYYYGAVSGCTVSGTTTISGTSNIGGIAGHCESCEGGIIGNNISGAEIKGSDRVGGLVGYSMNSIVGNTTDPDKKNTVEDCTVTGTSNAGIFAGFIEGMFGSTIDTTNNTDGGGNTVTIGTGN